ncbi:DUF4287 domain-containing protein [Thermomonas brevis]
MTADATPKGPASYFPSIEKAYGKPVAHWFQVLDAVQDRPHMAQVAFLKANHGIGHGHANALVAYRKGGHGA